MNTKRGFLTVRVPEAWVEKLDRLAEKNGTSRSIEHRAAIERHIKKVAA